MQAMIPNFFRTYTTPRLLQADNAKLQLCYLLQLAVILVLFALYAIVYHQAHQQRCPVRGVTTFQSFGGFFMPEEALKLVKKYPNVYQSFWSASDVIERSSDGFTVVSHIVVTPNQTQSNCAESPNVPNSICTISEEEYLTKNYTYTKCAKGSQSVSGVQTGECVHNTQDTLKFYDIPWGDPGTTTCEVSGWCPLLPVSPGKPYGNSTDGHVLEYSKNLIVLLKTSSDFPMCGEKYFGLQDPGGSIPQCTYHPVNNPSCPWFTIHDLVLYAGFISYANVASTGQIFRITVHWDCDFDWKETCTPTYSITPVFGRYRQWESFYWENPIYYGQGTRKLVRKFGLKFIIEHDGEGKKTTVWLLMKTLSLGFPYLFIPGFVITLLYNKFFKNITAFKRKKYYQYSESEDCESLITVSPTAMDVGRLKHV
ncbi:P2X purinoceptor 1 [Orchesella cincta]|uniref:P2X purinoceptor 1 n=1 Tax=Orchesella cincta TaxID=48709 RepID=A0A1D2MQ81_ORCCI|nr:P2X purinoceptor 1 [Orchesella cincta]